MSDQTKNFICPICGSTKRYAKGLCKNCYTRERRRTTGLNCMEYPANLLVAIGINLSDITDEMSQRLDSLIEFGIFSESTEYVLMQIFKEHNTISNLARKLNCSRQNIHRRKDDALKVLRGSYCLDYLYGSEIKSAFVKVEDSPEDMKNDSTVAEEHLEYRVEEFRERLEDNSVRLEKLKCMLKENKLISKFDDLTHSCKITLKRIGINTVSDLIYASKVLPNVRMSPDTFKSICEWSKSHGIIIGRDLGGFA